MDDSTVIDEIDDIVNGALISYVSFGLQQFFLVTLAYLVSVFVSPSAYGFISVFTRFQSYSMRIFGGLNTALFRTLPRLDKREQNAILTGVIPLLILGWGVVGGIIYSLRKIIIQNTLLLPKHESAIIAFTVVLLPFLFLMFISGVFRIYKSMRISHILWTVGRPFLFVITTFVLLLIANFSILNFWVILIGLSIVTVFVSGYLLHTLEEFWFVSPTVAIEELSDFLIYSGYSSISTIFRILQSSTTIFIAIYLSPITAGAIGVSMVLGDIGRWPLKSINQIFPQIATRIYDDNDIFLLNNLYEITSVTITLFTIPFFALYLLFDASIIGLFSNSYKPYSYTLIIISFGQLIASVFGSVGLLLMMTDNERPALVIQFIMAVVTIPLYYYMSRTFGIDGVAVSFLIAITINNTVELITLWYFEGLFPFTTRHIWLTLFSTIVFGLLYTVFTFTNIPIIIQLILFVFGVILYYIISKEYILTENDKIFLNSIKSQFV